MNKTPFARRFVQCASALALSVTALCATASADKPGEGVKVTGIFPSVAEERFRGEIALQGLRELGYKVQEPKETEYATMILAVPMAMPISP